MLNVCYYFLIFCAPLLGYFLWRRFLRERLGFLFLLPLIVAFAWLASWPIHNALLDSAQDRDVAINGFVFLGWFPPLIGCLPIILLDAIISLVEWIKGGRQKKSHMTPGGEVASTDKRLAEQVGASDGVKLPN